VETIKKLYVTYRGDLFYYIPSNTTVTYGGFDFTTPMNMDVVVLTQAGIEFLLGAENAALLLTKNYDKMIEKIAENALKRAASFKEVVPGKKLRVDTTTKSDKMEE